MIIGMVKGAIEDAQVIPANGGHPTSKIEKSNSRLEIIISTAGAIFITKKSNNKKIPENPTPSFKADTNILLNFMPKIVPSIIINIGSITNALKLKMKEMNSSNVFIFNL
jgi:hypothetical protein